MNLIIENSEPTPDITLEGVISYTITNKDNPTIQIVHKSGDAVHVDIHQSPATLNTTNDFTA